LSMGISSMVPDPENDFSMLLKRADEALYRAKQEGRNRICIAV